jgi:hypothetical protein
MLYLPAVMHQTRTHPVLAGRTLAAVAAGTLLLLSAAPRALGGHEVPARVALTAFVHADDARPGAAVLRIVLRAPLESMRDIEIPLGADGALDAVAVRPLLDEAARIWVAGYLRAWEDGRLLDAPRVIATRIALPNDGAFASYAAARTSFAAPPVGDDVRIPWQQALIDVLLEVPITDARARFALDPALGHLGVRTTSVLHLVLPDGRDRVFVYEGDPGRIDLDPSAWRAAARFLREGFGHILGGVDHLLFVLCLVLPVRRLRPLVEIVTAFTVAHSLTLGTAALGLVPGALWFPPLVEVAIAASILVLTLENVLLPAERLERRWRMAFAFGLIHGFGFSFALGEQLQFAGAHLVSALAAFNVGVELGQLLVLLAALPLLHLARRHAGEARAPLVTVVGSVLVAHTAWHWMTARWATLAEYRAGFAWPALDATFALGALRVALLLAVALALAAALPHILRMPRRPRSSRTAP